MPELLTQLTSFTVFVGIAAVGFCFLLISLIFGEVFEHFGDFDHDIDHGPTFFSPRVLSVFITAFGAAGAIAIHYGFSSLGASIIGFLNGMIFGTMIFWFAKFLHGQQASTHVEGADLAGKVGRVTIAIPAGGVGQVRVQLGDELVDKVAKSKSGEAIRENNAVVIDQVLGEIVVVRPQ